MRVDKSDLDDRVVEDGETTIIPKSETKPVPARTQDVNSVHLKKACSEESDKPQNGIAVPMTKKREPVEDSDEAELSRRNGEKGADCLTAMLQNCNISAADDDSSSGFEKHLAALTVKDADNKNEESESPASVITVDPPSLPNDEEEENGESSEAAEQESQVEPRGPTAGKPTNFRVGNDAYNHVTQKSYYSHNFEKFMMPTAIPQQYHPQQQMYGYSSGTDGSCPFNSYNNFNTGTNVMSNSYSGKRQMDDDDENPFKYTRPQPSMNDLNIGGRNLQHAYPSLGSGGQVTENLDLLPESLPFEMGSLDRQFSLTDVDNMLQALDAKGQQTDFDLGYTSENSPHSENMGSPGSSPKSDFSPQRPPSNMSGDSGIASPYSEDSMQSVIPSPASDHTTQSSNGRNTSSPHSVATSSQPPSVGPRRPGSVHDKYGSQYSGMIDMQAPGSVGDDCSMASDSSPSNHQNLDTYFDEHRDDLKDALEVVASDIIQSESKKKNMNGNKIINGHPSTISGVPPHSNGIMSQSPMSATPATVQGQVPQMAPQQVSQMEGRPNKLPIPALSKNVSTGNVTQKQGAPSMSTVIVVPNTMAQQGQPVSNGVPVTSSQPVLMIPPSQGGQSIIVLPFPVSATPQPTLKKEKFVPIRPKIPSTSSTPSVTSDTTNTTVKTEVTSAKVGLIEHSAPDIHSISAVNCGPAGVQNSPCGRPPLAPSPGRRPCSHNRNGQQPKMLNVARRLVAAMTTEDLQFKDNEGDTYLHVSVCKADQNMVQALLERLTREKLQAMINSQNMMRQTPLYLAVSSNHPEMVELLIQYGADVNLFAEHIQADGRSKEVKAALHCAASNGAQYLATLQALLSAQELMIDLVNSDGHTALHCAILEHGKQRANNEFVDNLPIIEALIKHGADPNAQGKKSGKTALMYVLESRNIVLIEHVVTLIDPARLRTFLKTPAFDSSTCLRIMENVQRDLSPEHRQRLQACLKMNGSR